MEIASAVGYEAWPSVFVRETVVVVWIKGSEVGVLAEADRDGVVSEDTFWRAVWDLLAFGTVELGGLCQSKVMWDH